MAALIDIKLMLVVAIVIVYHMKNAISVETCNPQKMCLTRFGENVANPLDKDSYFMCVKDIEGTVMSSNSPIKCPPNTTFDPYSNGHTGSCNKVHRTFKTLCINACNGECNNYHYERIANINDCSSFYTCLPGNKKAETRCPPDNPYFDGSRCQRSKYLCCTCCDECTNYCHDKNIQIADPLDCRSFYICFERGLPEPENRYQCEEGNYFNKSKWKCEVEDQNNPCVPSCKNETIANKTKSEKTLPK